MNRKYGNVPIGEKHNAWTSLGATKKVEGSNGKTHTKQLFQCECGIRKWKKPSDIRAGRSKKCSTCSHGKDPRKLPKLERLTPEERERKAYVDRLWPDK